MGGEPGDHRDAEPVQVIGELVQLGAVDAGIDQDQPFVRAHHGGVGPDPLALPDPDAVGHLFSIGSPYCRRGVCGLGFVRGGAGARGVQCEGACAHRAASRRHNGLRPRARACHAAVRTAVRLRPDRAAVRPVAHRYGDAVRAHRATSGRSRAGASLLVAVAVFDSGRARYGGPPILGWIALLVTADGADIHGEQLRRCVMPLAALANCLAGFLIVWLLFDVVVSDDPTAWRAGLMTGGLLIVMFFGFAIYRVPPRHGDGGRDAVRGLRLLSALRRARRGRPELDRGGRARRGAVDRLPRLRPGVHRHRDRDPADVHARTRSSARSRSSCSAAARRSGAICRRPSPGTSSPATARASRSPCGGGSPSCSSTSSGSRCSPTGSRRRC